MADPNLDDMSRDELKKLSKDIDKALATEESRRKTKAREAIEATAKEHGFTLEDFVAGGGGKTKGGKAAQPPKYAHPENPETTWSGRGRQPVWFKEALEGGASAEDLLIEPAA